MQLSCLIPPVTIPQNSCMHPGVYRNLPGIAGKRARPDLPSNLSQLGSLLHVGLVVHGDATDLCWNHILLLQKTEV